MCPAGSQLAHVFLLSEMCDMHSQSEEAVRRVKREAALSVAVPLRLHAVNVRVRAPAVPQHALHVVAPQGWLFALR